MIVNVLVPIALENFYSYNTDLELNIGDIVNISFRNKETIGVVFETNVVSNLAELKSILSKIDITPLKKEIIDLIKWTSEYYLIPMGMVLRMTIAPINYCKKINTFTQDIQEFNINKLNEEQEKAKNFISSIGGFNTFVLEGKTGSGKTEVYFHLIKDILLKNEQNTGQVLILLPEISLTFQIILRFKKQFNFEPAIWHSDITKSQKSKVFYGVINGNTKVVIGTRSALFLPFKNLQLIIVDEEHDSSYRQTEGGSYNGKNVAIMRAKLNNIPIILVSATPSIETLINIDNKKHLHFKIENRYGGALLPKIEIVDLKKEKLKNDHYLSKQLIEAINKNLIKSEQSMIFMNRRGYAPIILCTNCGEKIKCPDCNCNLTYHKAKNKLLCHLCGYKQDLPEKCPVCRSEKIIKFGPAVEKIEKEILESFENAKTMILSSDTTNNNKKLSESINKILNNEVDIIIGTQLITKGHHFPNLTLVGVIDSDASMFSNDIRANEKTYQLLTQVAGRAGRENLKGMVYLQSYNIDNLVIQSLKNNIINDFIEYEKNNRKLGNFAPFGQMATINIISNNETDSNKTAKEIAYNLSNYKKIEVLGPTQIIFPRKHCYNITVKCDRKFNIQKVIKNVINFKKNKTNIRINLDW